MVISAVRPDELEARMIHEAVILAMDPSTFEPSMDEISRFLQYNITSSTPNGMDHVMDSKT